MATFLDDSLTDTDDTLLENHAGETGATWAVHPSYSSGLKITGNAVVSTTSGPTLYVASGAPAGAEYDVEIGSGQPSPNSNRRLGCAFRVHATDDTFYEAERQTQGVVRLRKMVAGTLTVLGSYDTASSGTLVIKAECRNAAKKVYVDSVERISSTDNEITAAGKAGLYQPGSSGAGTPSVQYITATDVAAGVEVTPGTATVALAGFAPSVTVSDHRAVTPGTAAVVLAGPAPAVGPIVIETFTVGAAGAELSTRVGETGAGWEAHPLFSPTAVLSDAARARASNTVAGERRYLARGVPVAADYDVEGVMVARSTDQGRAYIAGRLSPTANTGVFAEHNLFLDRWSLYEYVDGVIGNIGTWDEALADEEARTARIEFRGSTVTLVVGGVPRVSGTTAVAAAGRIGIGWGFESSDTTGLHIDLLRADYRLGAVSVAPGVAATALAGPPPAVAVSDHRTVTPGTGAVSWAGPAPVAAASDHRTVTPGTAAVTATGPASTVAVSDHVTVVPGTGNVAATGYAPAVAVSDHVTVVPGTAAVTVAGPAPTVTADANVTAEPGTGNVTWAGTAPAVTASDHRTAVPGVAAASWAGFAPTVGVTVSAHPGTASVALAGPAPTVEVTSGLTAVPGTAAATLVGYAPAVAVSDHVTVVPGTAAVIWAGPAPAVVLSDHVRVEPAQGVLSVTGPAPAAVVTDHRTVLSGVAAVITTGYAPTVTAGAGVTVEPGTGDVTAAGPAPTVAVTAHRTAVPGTGNLTATGYAPAVGVTAHRVVVPVTAAVVAGGPAPAVTVSAHVTLSPGVALLLWGGYAPDVIGLVPRNVTAVGGTRNVRTAVTGTRPAGAGIIAERDVTETTAGEV